MSPEIQLQPIPIPEFEHFVESIDSARDLIVVTLTNTDIFIGSKFKYWREPTMAFAFPRDHITFSLAFNGPEGRKFGHSEIVNIPIDQIANMSTMPIKGLDTLSPDSYPNPLATIFYDHNIHLAELHEFEGTNYGEKAFSPDAIPPDGIFFKNDLLIYIDYAFFEKQERGSLSVSLAISPVITISRDGKRSLQDAAIHRVKSSIAQASKQKRPNALANYVTIQGCIMPVEPPQNDTIEGEDWHIYGVADQAGVMHVVLIKMHELKYPPEFFNRVNSYLCFYGEQLPIPLTIFGEKYETALLVRGIIHSVDQL